MAITLIGFPNIGKTTLFNVLTQSNEKTSNFSGVTVYAKSKQVTINNHKLDIVDLPGISSLVLMPTSKDELVVTDYIKKNPNDLYINIINIEQLERQLFFTLSLLAKKMKIIVVINMIDSVDISIEKIMNIKRILNQYLDVPICLVSAKNKKNIDELIEIIDINHNKLESININNKINDTLQNDSLFKNKLIKEIMAKIGHIAIKSHKINSILDNIFLNKFIGFPIFMIVMFVIFNSVMRFHNFASPIIADFIHLILVDYPTSALEHINANEIFVIILADGIGGGVETMFSFAPIVLSLFFFLNLLEKTGYMARQAFLVDSIMQKIGLPGKAFISLIMGLGCTAACASGCRTLERESDRKLSLMMSPSLSCSAKLPVYIFIVSLVFSSYNSIIVFLLYFIGMVIAVINGLFLSHSLFNNIPMPFIMEIPPYRIPSIIDLIYNALIKLKNFLWGLGKKIVPIIAIITILNSVNFSGEINKDDPDSNIIASISRAFTPLLSPMGITENNWEATFSLITGFLAKEIVAGTLDNLYFKSADDINKKAIFEEKFGGTAAIFAFLLFVLLYSPCVSAMGAIANEIGTKWAWLVGLWSTWNAFAFASMYYQLVSNDFSMKGFLYVLLFITIYVIIFFIYKYIGEKHSKQWAYNFVISKKNNN
jgi:ferrous iron transport protein B